MATQQYTYTKEINITKLIEEISASSITIALSHINTSGNDVYIYFKTQLSTDEIAVLDGLIESHTSDKIPPEQLIVPARIVKQTSDEEIPFVQATSMPIDHMTYFSGAGDLGDGLSGRGQGAKILFKMESTDISKSVDLTFNEDVYLKDGFIMAQDAPFGSSLDIDIVYPLDGSVIEKFGSGIPLLGTGWWPLDTEARGFLPKGLIVRITVHNSTGLDAEDTPSSFKVNGRLELFRKSSRP